MSRQGVLRRQEQDDYVLEVQCHAEHGEKISPSPPGSPLSENLSPTVGYAQSVTQLLNSVAKLPFDRIHSGALNVRLRRDAVRGEAGLIRLKALIETYFEQGGMQLQVSIADTEDLRRAQQCPENYGDLSVRITGYSAIYVDMSPTAQEEFIRRDELG